jgi:hypothetical protein
MVINVVYDIYVHVITIKGNVNNDYQEIYKHVLIDRYVNGWMNA